MFVAKWVGEIDYAPPDIQFGDATFRGYSAPLQTLNGKLLHLSHHTVSCNGIATLFAWWRVGRGVYLQQKHMDMRKFVFAFAVLVLVGSAFASAQKKSASAQKSDIVKAPGSVTFKVEDVMVAEKILPVTNGFELGRKLAGGPYLDCSFKNKSLVDGGDNPFFSMVCLAYAEHRPIVLSPDIMWILICNGFSQHVNREPDRFRDYLVSHEGKMRLEITTYPETTTAQKVEMFAGLIGENTKGDLDELLTCNFSTTGMVERMTSQITLMDAVKPYFDFVEHLIGCGIPSVTLEGTPDDWKLLREKTRELGNYGVKAWTDRLDPILKEFVAASEGNPNVEFWWDMAIKGRPLDFHLKDDGCLPLFEATRFDGWFLEFIPFDLSVKRPSEDIYESLGPTEFILGKRPYSIVFGHKLPPVITSVTVTQHIYDGLGNIIQTNYLEVRAGIVGLTQDVETMALRPEIGWLVKYQYSGIPIPLRDTTSVNTIRADKPDETKVVVSGGKPSAGDIITGNVRDNEGPMMVVNVIERDGEERIVAHCVTDMEGNFDFKLVDPDHYLEISYVGYRTVKTPITGTHFEITMSERDDLPKVEIMSDRLK